MDSRLDSVQRSPFRRRAEPPRTENHQTGHAQERKLRADVEQIVRIEGQNDQPGEGEHVEADPSPAEPDGGAGGHDQDGRPHDRRLGVNQQHIREHKDGRGRHGNPPRQQAAEDHARETGDDAQMEPRDHQQMDRAGKLEGLDLVGIELFAKAQEHSRGQVGLTRLQITGEDLPPAQPQRFEQ